MTTRTERIDHHICDLCGQEKPKEEIATLYSEPSPIAGRLAQGKRCDICARCQGDHVVAEVLCFFLNAKRPTGLKEPNVHVPPHLKEPVTVVVTKRNTE